MTCTISMKNGKTKKYKKVKSFSICTNNPNKYMLCIAIKNSSKYKFITISECENFMLEEENGIDKENK